MEKWLILIPGVFIILLLGGLGYAIKYKGAYWLISGYNTMPEEKKKNVDIEALGRFLGSAMFAGCGIIGLAFVFFALGITAGGIACMALLLPGIIYMLVIAQKFDGNATEPDGRLNTKTKGIIAAVILLLGGVAVGVDVLMNTSARPAEFIVGSGVLDIKCAFGQTIALQDISGLELVQAMPAIGYRSYGSAMGDKLRGSFQMADGTPARIYTENALPPFIHFTREGAAYYINTTSADSTKALYDELEKAVK